MITESLTDDRLLAKIRERDRQTLAAVYQETFPMVVKHVTAHNGSKEDAQDIFQDAFYLLICKSEDPGFSLTSKVSTFLVGISKNLWLKRLTKNSVHPDVYRAEVQASETPGEDDDFTKLQRTRLVAQGLEQLGEPCRTLLVQYYYAHQTMKEIAALLHYTNAENAKNQKYKCLQRLKKLVTGKMRHEQ